MTRVMLLAGTIVALTVPLGSGGSAAASRTGSGMEAQAQDLPQARIHGFAKRILRGDSGTSTVHVIGDGGGIFPVDPEGYYSGNVRRGNTYDVEVVGEHRTGRWSNVIVDRDDFEFNVWLVDNDDADASSKYHFLWRIFRALYLAAGDRPLTRWDKNPRLRIFKGNWDRALMNTIGLGKTSTDEIVAAVESSVRESISRMGCGRLRCVQLAEVVYVPGEREPAAPVPADLTIDVCASVGTGRDVVRTQFGFSGNEVVGGVIDINVAHVADKIILPILCRMGAAKILGVVGDDSSDLSRGLTVVRASSPMPVDFTRLDINDGTVHYSLPIGWTDDERPLKDPH